jgi:high-affinity iron transporter
MKIVRRAALAIALIVAALGAGPAFAQQDNAQTAWRLLDYLAVDYSGAVENGKVVSPTEYAEMQEFSATAAAKIAALPAGPAKGQLVGESKQFVALVERKASAAEVAAAAHALGQHLLEAYPVTMAPAAAPDLDRGAALYASTCASCHGATGHADTPTARALKPPPIAFADRARADQRSPFALYQVLSQGLDGTAMASFSNLRDKDRWALAYHVGGLAYSPELVEQGKRLWESQPALRAQIPDLARLSSLTAEQLGQRIGQDGAEAVVAYLRAHPEAVTTQASTLGLARERLRESVAAYQAGDAERARSLALSAYLDGFEPVEASLATRNGELLATVERAMGELRAAIGSGRPASEVAAKAAEIDALFADVEATLSADEESAASAFVGGLTILLREGLEALLIVIGMLAFLRKADRREMERPVHYGWIGALAAGGLTWIAATTLISGSGASRELTEGCGSLLAAVVLLFVGIWMHGKAQADHWQRYIREKMHRALSGRSAWFLFALAFIAVYRELFETILFYAAMASQGNVRALVAGGLTGAALLAVIAVAMLRYSQRLPIGKFFAYSSALVAVLAVVLAGKGVAALQEAGILGIRPLLGLPRISVLGLFPTLQTIAVQIGAMIILLIGFALNRRSTAPANA